MDAKTINIITLWVDRTSKVPWLRMVEGRSTKKYDINTSLLFLSVVRISYVKTNKQRNKASSILHARNKTFMFGSTRYIKEKLVNHTYFYKLTPWKGTVIKIMCCSLISLPNLKRHLGLRNVLVYSYGILEKCESTKTAKNSITPFSYPLRALAYFDLNSQRKY